ncbi:hypothetical protein GCM10010149_83440 [Nonomuraea roseoviolacea subsp. roseoviolacea]
MLVFVVLRTDAAALWEFVVGGGLVLPAYSGGTMFRGSSIAERLVGAHGDQVVAGVVMSGAAGAASAALVGHGIDGPSGLGKASRGGSPSSVVGVGSQYGSRRMRACPSRRRGSR